MSGLCPTFFFVLFFWAARHRRRTFLRCAVALFALTCSPPTMRRRTHNLFPICPDSLPYNNSRLPTPHASKWASIAAARPRPSPPLMPK